LQGSLYKYCDETRTWKSARRHCQRKGGELASFMDITSLRAAFKLWNDAKRPVWLGAYKRVRKDRKVWAWSDESPFTFERFARKKNLEQMGTTHRNAMKSDCAAIGNVKYGYNRRWFTQPCEAELTFLCKM